MFYNLKKEVLDKFNTLAADNNHLFYVDVDREKIWKKYLDGFAEDKRQENNCNACKSFLRQWGGIVAIKDNKLVSIWDIENVPDEYKQSIRNVSKYIHSLPIKDVFYESFASLGTDKNFDSKLGVNWNHFHIKLPTKFVVNKLTIDTKRSQLRTNQSTLFRALSELTVDATETVLELISQNSLYKGAEFKSLLESFLKLQKEFQKIPVALRTNFTWVKSIELHYIASIRNMAIGTLLVNLSEGMELDLAVTKYEKVVAPTNYKRPTAIVTPKMVANAKQTLADLGLLPALERRLATEADLNVNNVLFTDKSSNINDVFDEISKGVTVDKKKLSKVEEISIEDFIKNVLPTAKGVEVLFENNHLPNLVTLLTAVDKDAPNLFKWNNPFSWSYTGGITDSIKEKVKAAGGKVEGELRVSLSWFNYDDLDLHIIEPDSNIRIYYGNKRSTVSDGVLDVDMNAGCGTTRNPVENVIWQNKNKMREGEYTVLVNNFSLREKTNTGFEVEIEHNGVIYPFQFKTNPSNGATHTICKFTYNRKDGIKFHQNAESKVLSKEKWRIKTNQFYKVEKIMLSPNYWDEVGTGNKHYMFFIPDCKNDEEPRPFFNEFLRNDLNEHRKTMEMVGSKVKVDNSIHQLSGLGFSDTQRNSIIVRVDGKFKRNLKVNF